MYVYLRVHIYPYIHIYICIYLYIFKYWEFSRVACLYKQIVVCMVISDCPKLIYKLATQTPAIACS